MYINCWENDGAFSSDFQRGKDHRNRPPPLPFSYTQLYIF